MSHIDDLSDGFCALAFVNSINDAVANRGDKCFFIGCLLLSYMMFFKYCKIIRFELYIKAYTY